MTSLLKHITELERTAELKSASIDCYANAVQTMSQYAVEVEHPLTERHRRNLESVRHLILGAQDPDALAETKSALRAELRDYRDKCGKELTALRQEFMATVTSLQEVMATVATSGNDWDQDLAAELKTLRKLVDSGDPEELRRGVASGIRTIAASVERMRHIMELTIAQFKDEVRVLQRRLHDVEASTAIDKETGALNRKEFEARVRRYVLRDGSVTLAFVKATNLADISRAFGSYLTGEAVCSMYKRLRVSVGDKADVGRWTDDVFAIVLTCGKEDAMRMSRDFAVKLSGTYVCMQEGAPTRLSVQTAIGIADCVASEDPDQFLSRVDSLTRSLC